MLIGVTTVFIYLIDVIHKNLPDGTEITACGTKGSCLKGIHNSANWLSLGCCLGVTGI